ncbi:unnamed protein product, partial [Polarella glacialis]
MPEGQPGDVSLAEAAFAAAAVASRALPLGLGLALHVLRGSLPRHSATGKVDRAKLIELLRASPPLSLAACPPQSTLADEDLLPSASEARAPGPGETTLLSVVAEVLGLPSPVSASASFLSLGGDSSSAVRAAAAAAKRGLPVKALDLLRASSLDVLVARLEAELSVEQGRPPAPKRLRRGLAAEAS